MFTLESLVICGMFAGHSTGSNAGTMPRSALLEQLMASCQTAYLKRFHLASWLLAYHKHHAADKSSVENFNIA